MTGWYIAAAVLCVLIALALLRIRIVLSYTEEVSAKLQILFFRFTLYPRKKRVSLRRYTYRRYRKRLLAQRKKESQRKPKPQVRASAKKKRPLKESMRLYQYLFSRLYKRILHHFRIDVARLHVTVATGDAAQTAIATGIVSQAVAYVMEILSNHTNLHHSYHADVRVEPDFLAEKSKVSCKLLFSLRVYEIIDIGIRFFYHYLLGSMRRQNSLSK